MDNYEWLREKESAEVVEHLKAENAYQEAVTAHQEPLREAIFQEIKGRTQETDLSVPNRKDGWWYFSRSVEGKEYGIQCRVKRPGHRQPGGRLDSPGGGGRRRTFRARKSCWTATWKPKASRSSPWAAPPSPWTATSTPTPWTTPATNASPCASRTCAPGEMLPDVIENIFYGVSFSPDGTRLFYTVVDDSWRPYQVKSHVLGTPVTDDEVIYQEDDVAMWLGFELSSDRRHLVLGIGCSEYSETRLLRFDDYDAGLTTVISRDERVLYEAEPFLLGP